MSARHKMYDRAARVAKAEELELSQTLELARDVETDDLPIGTWYTYRNATGFRMKKIAEGQEILVRHPDSIYYEVTRRKTPNMVVAKIAPKPIEEKLAAMAPSLFDQVKKIRASEVE